MLVFVDHADPVMTRVDAYRESYCGRSSSMYVKAHMMAVTASTGDDDDDEDTVSLTGDVVPACT